MICDICFDWAGTYMEIKVAVKKAGDYVYFVVLPLPKCKEEKPEPNPFRKPDMNHISMPIIVPKIT